jgi:branched-chain amino acid transport system substrate-binding protein
LSRPTHDFHTRVWWVRPDSQGFLCCGSKPLHFETVSAGILRRLSVVGPSRSKQIGSDNRRKRRSGFGWFLAAISIAIGGLASAPIPARGATKTTKKPSVKVARKTTKPASAAKKGATTTEKLAPGLDGATVAAARGFATTRSPAKGEPYPIGLLLAQASSDPSVVATANEQKRGAELAVAFVNELGGIGGRPVSLTIAEEGSSAESAARSFEFLSKRGVLAVIGPTVSKHTRLVAQSAAAERTLLFGASTTANGIPLLSPWVRRSALPPDVVATGAIAELLTTKPSTSGVVVAAADDPVGVAVADGYVRAFQQSGVQLLENPATFVRGQANVDAYAASVAALAPDVIVVTGSEADAATFVGAIRRTSARGVLLVDPASLTRSFVDACWPCTGILTPVTFDTEDSTSYSRALLLRRYYDAHGSLPTMRAAQGFGAVQVLAIALDAAIAAEQSAGSLATRRDSLRTAVVAGRYDTPFGLMTFDGQGEVKIDRVALGEIVRSNGVASVRAIPPVPSSVPTS